MSVFRIPLVRGVVTVALVGLFCLSVLRIQNIVATGWDNEQREGDLYRKSPNCMAKIDPVLVDKTLPPCQDFSAVVMAKSQKTVVFHGRMSNHETTYCRLTLRFDNGQVRTVGDISGYMCSDIHVADRVSVQFWRGEVRKVSANGGTATVVDPKKWANAKHSLFTWMGVGFVCSICLTLMWKKTNYQSRLLAPFG